MADPADPHAPSGPPRRISGAVRRAVLERDGRICTLCGRPVVRSSGRRGRVQHPGNLLTLDHIVPLAAGGGSTFENLRVACRSCNMGRKGTS